MFYELMAARHFHEGGFSLHVSPETGIKGQDFDFSATKGVEKVNVEVTHIGTDDYSAATLRNALGKKRGQVPDNAPAVIWCAFPKEWRLQDPKIETNLVQSAQEFYRITQRINVVVFMSEYHIEPAAPNENGVVLYPFVPVMNNRARHPTKLLDFLFDGTIDIRRNIADGASVVDAVEALKRDSKFYRWVDQIAGE
ncbi:MAG: hypothetical protein ABSD21_07595 [Rhizomicrobium sp.]